MLTLNDIINYGLNEVIAEFLRLLDIIELGSKYFFEYYKPDIQLIFHKYYRNAKILIHTYRIEIYYKTVPMNYINKFKLGLLNLQLVNYNNIKITYDLQLIKTIKCNFCFGNNEIIKTYPENVKKIVFYDENNITKINFNILKNLKCLDELIFENNFIIENLCESTDSPNSKEVELPITKLIISDRMLKPDILKYFKSLMSLKINENDTINFLQLTYFPKSLTTCVINNYLSNLLIYPNTPFYKFLTNQVKELRIHYCTNEDLCKLKFIEILEIYCYDIDIDNLIYKLPKNVYYLEFFYEKRINETELQKYLQLLLNNNPNLRILKINNVLRYTFLGIKIKNNTIKLNSREEILRAIQFKI
jgi:hypothetical protein